MSATASLGLGQLTEQALAGKKPTVSQFVKKSVMKRMEKSKKYRVLEGTHIQDPPQFIHFDFTAPAGSKNSPFEVKVSDPVTGKRECFPKVPFGAEDSPFNVEGVRKSVVYRARTVDDPPEYTGDVFESFYDFELFDSGKFQEVRDPHANESKEDRLARLKREIAEVETELQKELVDPSAGDTYDHMTMGELRKFAKETGIRLEGAQTKEEIIALLRQAASANNNV